MHVVARLVGVGSLMPVEITMFPAGIVKYRAVVDGAPITRPTRQPFLDGARALPWVMSAHRRRREPAVIRSRSRRLSALSCR